jgi:hypothetical protein
MFGFAPFGGVAFGDVPHGGPVSFLVNGALSAGSATIASGIGDFIDIQGGLAAQNAGITSVIEAFVDAEAGLVAQYSDIDGSIEVGVVSDGALFAGDAFLNGLMRRRILGAANLSGELVVSWVGTTGFISMIEAGEAELAVAAKITLRTQ